MLKMPKINSIRDKVMQNKSLLSIAKEENVDWKTVKKYATLDDFSPDPFAKVIRTSILDPFKPIIVEWLEEDQDRWYKQRHTAKKIFDCLCEEHGYEGSYSTVRRFVKVVKEEYKQGKEYGELVWNKGEAQCDFGEADVFENGLKVRRYYLVLSFPYSNKGFFQVFRSENAECVCQGLMNIFLFLAKVPHRIIFDNATGIGKRICGELKENNLFSKFRQHFGFLADYCNPNSGHEKGNVENKVGFIRRNYFVPEPHYTDLEIFNQEILEKCLVRTEDTHYKKERTC